MIKDQKNILQKLNITKLNEMQLECQKAAQSSNDIVLLSPTGSGKTLAFLLPLIAKLDKDIPQVQALILVPSRELALQIELVMRSMGTGHKVNAVYGGRSGAKDRADLKTPPAVLIATPGRLADRLRRESIDTTMIKTLVLDEFDKSLEIGFESEMKEIIGALSRVEQRILTSATQGIEIPSFVQLHEEITIDYSGTSKSQLEIKRVMSPTKDKLTTLVDTLRHIGNEPGIIFCNFKDTIHWLSEELDKQGVPHGCFYGGMEQKDRERSLIKFRNGTHRIILATDLAARGLDISDLKFIIHYQLPHKSEEFTHRNGRTARMNSEGAAYVVQWEKETCPEFIPSTEPIQLKPTHQITPTKWTTLFVSGGRKDKISKGDIAGTFMKQAELSKDDVGVIEVKSDCTFVGIKKGSEQNVISKLNNTRIKKKKVRITLI